MDQWQQRAEELVDFYVAPQGIRNPEVLAAMKQLPRHLFVPKESQAYGYIDLPLAIGEAQTISQPFMVARMTELLDVKKGDQVLEIGTGSGYQAALLAEMGMKVTTVERIEVLAQRARGVFGQLGYSIDSILGDGTEGYLPNAPYQGVMVTAGSKVLAEAWLDQLTPGGKIVVPIWVEENVFQLLVRQKQTGEQGYVDTLWEPCRFVPLREGVQRRTKFD